MKPEKKASDIEKLLSMIAGKDRTQTIENDQCMTCDFPDMHFRAEININEYRISGMCQKCQDKVFGKGNFECNMCGKRIEKQGLCDECQKYKEE